MDTRVRSDINYFRKVYLKKFDTYGCGTALKKIAIPQEIGMASFVESEGTSSSLNKTRIISNLIGALLYIIIN